MQWTEHKAVAPCDVHKIQSIPSQIPHIFSLILGFRVSYNLGTVLNPLNYI